MEYVQDQLLDVADYLNWKYDIRTGEVYIFSAVLFVAVLFIQLLTVGLAHWMMGIPVPRFYLGPLFGWVALKYVIKNLRTLPLIRQQLNRRKTFDKVRSNFDEENVVLNAGNGATQVMKRNRIKELMTPKKHNDVVIVTQRQGAKVAGIILIKDAKYAEYFCNELPECCLIYADPTLASQDNTPPATHHPASDPCCHFPEGDASYRIMIGVIEMWGHLMEKSRRKDVLFEDVTFLNSYVKMLELNGPCPDDSVDEIKLACDCIEFFKNTFKPFAFHSTENYISTVGNSELWDDLVDMVNLLTVHNDEDFLNVWKTLYIWDEPKVSRFTLKRRQMTPAHFHKLGHPSASTKKHGKKVQFKPLPLRQRDATESVFRRR